MKRPTDTPGWRAARRFVEWYQQQPLTQAEAAKLLGVSQSHMSRILRGMDPLSVKRLDQAAAAMGIPVADLFTGEASTVWDSDDWPVIAQVHELPPEVRRAFVDQWRASLTAMASLTRSKEKEAGDAEPQPVPKKRR